MEKLKTFLKERTWMPNYIAGWGNGYVLLPKGHPAHGLDYDDINVEVHGGLTYAEPANQTNFEGLTDEDREGWIVGWDTAHYRDTPEIWTRANVEKENNKLEEQLRNYEK